jgi:hypothetical protein
MKANIAANDGFSDVRFAAKVTFYDLQIPMFRASAI